MFWEELYIRSPKQPNKMFKLFYKYLFLNKKASVPGVGVFSIERKPAKLDFSNKVFVAPSLEIKFKPDAPGADYSMDAFISREQKVDQTEAANRLNNFGNAIQEDLRQHERAELPGVGVLLQNAEGSMYFKPTLRVNDYFPPVPAERVLRENSEHHILVGDSTRTNTHMKQVFADDLPEPSHAKDYWWIFAIALGIIGIATIVFYYLNNGNLQ